MFTNGHNGKVADMIESRDQLIEETTQSRKWPLPTLVTAAFVVAALQLGKDVFLPLAIAMLITFALSPLVSKLRNRGLPMVTTVLSVVTVTFVAIGLFLMIVASQLGQLATSLPTFQSNIVTKLESLKDSGSETGVTSHVIRFVTAINDEITSASKVGTSLQDQAEEDRAMKVEVVAPVSALQTLEDVVVPIVSPIATAGLVIVVVIFMLLEREDLRDRFIRLVGSNDLHRTTEVLEEAGSRVANYLLMQLFINFLYAIPIGIGLYFIGVPNAPLWGMLTLVLRFVPYIGSVLAAAFPLFLAFAVAPGWSLMLWTAGLFAVVELISSNVVEPWLYGSRTGVSPLAIIVSAIVWTWIWGPLGLVMSTPLTVCLVVLGRHVPQFEVFDILFGDEPVLSPHSRLYQRLLAGDPFESTFRAQEALEDTYIADYYQEVGIPALLLAENDHLRGVMSLAQQEKVAASASRLVSDLQPVVIDEIKDLQELKSTSVSAEGEKQIEPLTGEGFRVVTLGGSSKLDDVAAAMLAQSMAADGADAIAMNYHDLSPTRFSTLSTVAADCIVLNFLDPSPSRASLLHIRRLKRAMPDLRVGVVIWRMPADVSGSTQIGAIIGTVTEAKIAEAEEIGADFVTTGLDATMLKAFTKAPARQLSETPRKPARPVARNRLKTV
jgi:predicted PurR-regulated permease PerM